MGIFRMVRFLRLARSHRMVDVLPELGLHLHSVIGAMKPLFWGCLFMLFALLIAVIIAVDWIGGINRRVTRSGVYENTGCERCPRAYATVAHAMVTIAQI